MSTTLIRGKTEGVLKSTPRDDGPNNLVDLNLDLPQPTPKLIGETASIYPLTDLGNAERLVHNFGRDIRYCHEVKSWVIWDNVNLLGQMLAREEEKRTGMMVMETSAEEY
jgi:hypothetical protein